MAPNRTTQKGASSKGPSSITVDEVSNRTCKITCPRGITLSRLKVTIKTLDHVDVVLQDVEALGTRNQNHIWFITFSTAQQQQQAFVMPGSFIFVWSGYISSLDITSHRMRLDWAPYHLPQAVLREALVAKLPEGDSLVTLGYEKSLVHFAVISFEGPASRLPHIVDISHGRKS